MVAHVALEGLLASVNPSPMFGQFVGQEETFAAPFARMRSFVGVPGFLMQKQFVASNEGFATFSAMKSGDACVKSHVVLETTWGFESSWTLKWKSKFGLIFEKKPKFKTVTKIAKKGLKVNLT